MGVIKCKICGASLDITNDSTVATCSYCSTVQTLPRLSSDRKANLYERASHFRRNNEFDKAIAIYEQVLEDDLTDSESYWSMILCKHGITYVDDPQTGKKVPTINRTQYTSIFSDEDYKSAIKYADDLQRPIYEAEAKVIDDIQKGILDIYSREKPFDVFICYKETDDYGRRTLDSVLAYDIYQHLERENFKVFFSRVTLEDKLGQEYEPYIFSALHSARVMIVLGTKPEYFEAAWVRNEWSRFLSLRQAGEDKTLIAAYRDMDPKKLPKEFSFLQAQDMARIGFIQELVAGCKKIVGVKTTSGNNENETKDSSGLNQLIKVGNNALRNKDWNKAQVFFDEAIEINGNCAEAYLGKFLIAKKCSMLNEYFEQLKKRCSDTDIEEGIACSEDLSHIYDSINKYKVEGYLESEKISGFYEFDRSYKMASAGRIKLKESVLAELESEQLILQFKLFATGSVKEHFVEEFSDLVTFFDNWISSAELDESKKREEITNSYKNYIFEADVKVKNLHSKALEEKSRHYKALISDFEKSTSVLEYEDLKDKFVKLGEYEHSAEYVNQCQSRINDLIRIEKEKRKIKITRTKKILAVIAVLIAFVTVGKLVFSSIKPSNKDVLETTVKSSFLNPESSVTLANETEFSEINAVDETPLYKTLNVGDTFEMGVYEGNSIEWLVLDINDEGAFIISKDIVCARAYNDNYENISWSDCSLRKWLNTDFYDSAFTVEEKSIIKKTSVINEDNTYYSVDAGDNTEDRIYLLSIDEVNTYFSDDLERKCELCGTFYFWWLRSPGSDLHNVASINCLGEIRYSGNTSDYENIGVRPVLWIGDKSSVDETEVLFDEIENCGFRVGDTVTLGEYNGKSMEWIILEKDDEKLLVISKDLLEERPYNDTSARVTWENCSLRNWLNGDFFNEAFSVNEQTYIFDTEINDENSINGPDGKVSTIDKIFILSLDEAETLFKNASSRQAFFGSERYGWWLRTPAPYNFGCLDSTYYSLLLTATVEASGSIDADGTIVEQNNYYYVRPAMWIDIGFNENTVVDESEMQEDIDDESLTVGDSFLCGLYDNKEIEWVILDIVDNKALVISKDIICLKKFRDSYMSVSWEDSSIRVWLNGEFYSEAFDSIEQSRIMSTTVTTCEQLWYYDDWTNIDTKDRIFLLSVEEVEKYLSDTNILIGQYFGSNCWWWLRSPCDREKTQDYASVVFQTGVVSTYGVLRDEETVGVRPAMWITIDQ